MQVKSNSLVKILVPVVLMVGGFIGIKSCSSTDSTAPNTPQNNVLSTLSPEELQALGVGGDTPEDTLRTLVGTLNKVRSEQQRLGQQNADILKENDQLRNQSHDVAGQIDAAVATIRKEGEQRQREWQDEQQGLLAQIDLLTERLNATPLPAQDSHLPFGAAVSQYTADPLRGQEELIWVTPADEKPLDPQHLAADKTTARFPASFLSEQSDTESAPLSNPIQKEENEQPVYTLPENATLVGSQAMTALLGRVPVNGTVTDPYPFKILIGKDNLTANGIELPEVAGAVVSGSASGDWTLACVRGQVNSITFVFQDGTVRTLPGSGQNNNTNANGIGWLSDENGIPCISGERKSNAATYLPTLFALSAMNSAGDALSESQRTAQTSGTGGITTALTGNAGQAALGKAMSGGMNDLSEWLKQRYSQTFDAVYVPPGARVVVHITQRLAIDYETKGRKVRYGVRETAQRDNQEALD
ncbi:TIGR03752 family integrating conjugative element protein [Xenorhabdus bovienii]|uniref:TIGR03752 family integrating conjugative element protein n=1 Tax=Xenorhabdus bovienii TaxID=40576 RepID=UPI0023B2575C|nr:TIGR03752 family integrating conjugative element protein [Xenorhabdus bovienii]MDE9452487.1 TIGR03752 family integrating conjugative element protein [Xenorhabdus bovienii]MDE9493733.1 TIGR03752 family integrating conjugative element protein [Xenorhabdus bovienii]MDE9502270.1 TIGR03752 family integrating conjugative element protein [Xenorhabdus bovienii]MDE9526079.1 TIGR03752 family integrating conjugative element protein [Xenorhabdus bovienii]MDE9569519.1 TIGR03752 family integrating conjug